MDKLKNIKNKALEAIKKAPDLGACEYLEKQYLGKSGELILFFKELKNMPDDERKTAGKEANEAKKLLEAELALRKIQLGGTAKKEAKKERLDVTAPGKKFERGHLHPLTLAMKKACDIFSSMGFEIVFGPDVESEYYNFDALNIPKDHPARDMWDTFWLRQNEIKNQKSNIKNSGGLLLRTHTSPVQIRYMEKHEPPFRIVAPGRCYRYEATDATHDVQFYQIEGLMIGESVNLSNLKEILESFFKQYFGKSALEIRFRPSYFPFTEPSVEVDLRMDSKSKWLEIAGAGMVHPKVLKNAGIDSEKWQGFAFGAGIDRLAMLKYKIDDIRLLYGSDLRFIKQF